MIDFSPTLQRSKGFREQRLREETLTDSAIAGEYEDNRIDSIDSARQMIAARPVFFIAIAFAVGGALGWLTSKQ